MKTVSLLSAFALAFSAAPAWAQWVTETYSLKGGWNAIFVHGDATHDDIGNLFPAQVTEVWRWNTNSTQVQFMESPLEPSAGTPEWSVWKRGLPAESQFTELSGQTAYLVNCSGTPANTYTATFKQSPLPPRAAWVRNGANLMGFPSKRTGPSSFPTFSNYFATFPAAIAANTKVFKYNGGSLGPANPIQIFSTNSEPLDRNRAYWFSAEVVENFHAPLEISMADGSGLDFGRSGSIRTLYIRNRSAAAVSLTLAPVASEAKPNGGQTDIAGPVSLSKLAFNTAPMPITAAYIETIPAGSRVELQFGIDRGAMGADEDLLYASCLRLTDGGNLMDVLLPVRAQPTKLAGLWAGEILVSKVTSKAPGSPGETTASPFPLRTLLHVPESGSPKLLSQVFIGQLAVLPHDVGVCTRESLLKQDAKAAAQRLVAAHMPLDQVISGSATVATGSTVTFSITVPFDDPTNPFVHQYHPDHDNKSARGNALPAGGESYNIIRTCTFTFTSSPPVGSTVVSGWGSSVIGGTYAESIAGLHKEPIQMSGTFELRHASEVGTLSQ